MCLMKVLFCMIPWCGVLVGTVRPSLYFHPTPVTLGAPERLRDNAFFGYSVAYETVSKKFIVGAPNADEIGKVFECNIKSKSCTENTPQLAAKNFNPFTIKTDGFWLGASIQAGNSFYVVCAPRTSNGDIIKWTLSGTTDPEISVNGTGGQCYIRHTATSNNEWEVMLPMTIQDRYWRGNQGLAIDQYQDSMAWSLSILNDVVSMGSPAVLEGKAAIYWNLNTRPTILHGFHTRSQTTINNFGYSVLIAKFSRHVWYFVSSPFGENGKGQVHVFKFKKTHDISYQAMVSQDDDVGFLYGASLCHIKITIKNEHKLNLLLVGSPAYRDRYSGNYDVGIVHVYNLKNKTAHSEIKGKKNGGYFGNTMVELKDLNLDNCSDLAVSAPYEDDGRGAVYIYSGATLLEPQPRLLQRIQPAVGARYFGLSLTPMPNLDDNGCNGLGIGAPGSGIALVLHCIPSVIVKLSVEIPDLQNRHRLESAEANETHFKFTWCLGISSKRPKLMKLDFNVVVKVDHQNAKLLDIKSQPQDDANIYDVIMNERKLCKNSTVYLPKTGYYENPLHITVTAVQVPHEMEEYDPGRVMVSDLSSLNVSEQVWAAECRIGAHCEPSLHADAFITVDNNYVIGSTEEEALKIAVNNSGETAYNLCVSVRVSGALVKVAPECEQDGAQGGWRCPAPGPLRRDAQWKLKDIILDMASLNSTAKVVNYKLKLLIHCRNVTKRISNSIVLQRDVQGVAVKGIDNFEGRVRIKDNLKKHIVHKYTITNNGTTKWVDLKFKLTIPREKYIEQHSIDDLTIRPVNATCILKNTTNSTELACKIGELLKGDIISVSYTSTVITKKLENGNLSLETTLELDLGDNNKTVTIRTLIQVEKLGIPIWIITIAVVIGLLLLVLIVSIMHELGLLKRKSKEKLEGLRASVRRQTMRQSTADAFPASDKDMKDLLVQEDDFSIDNEGVCEIIEPAN